MSTQLKRILFALGILAAFYLGVRLTNWYSGKLDNKTEEKATVLLEKIKTVAKLVSVEGYFSEIYDYKDYWAYDFSPFRKKALLRVKAKVSVGFDLSNMKMEVKQAEKKIFLSELPDPQILSIDHDIDYYDITEGTFNSFSNEDYTRLNANAKKFIEKKALESDLFLVAEEQGSKIFEMINVIAEGAGFTVEFVPRTNFPEEKTAPN